MTIVREFAESDREALLTVVRELQSYEGAMFDRMKPPEDVGNWYIDVLKKQCDEDDGHILVAERDGAIIGYATIMTNVREDGSYDEVPYSYGYVGDLAVLPQARGSGAGKLLLDECDRRARAAGRRWLRIGVLARNARAREVYGRFGFADLLVTMEKPLT